MPDYTVGRFKGSIKEIAEHFGVKYKTIMKRRHLGWTLEESVGLVERARSKVFEVGGFVGTKKEIASHFGIKYETFISRLNRGWTLEEAVGLVERDQEHRGEVFEVGEFKGTIKEIAEHFGVKYETIMKRRDLGWTLEEAIGIAGRGLNEITKYSLNGIEGTISELCTHFGIVYPALAHSRLRSGWSLRRAITEPRNEPFQDPEVFEVEGFKGTRVEIAEHFGVKYAVLTDRIRRGWTIEEAVGLVERQKPIIGKVFEVGGFKGTKKEIASHFGIKYQTFINRLNRGWTLEEAAGVDPKPNQHTVGEFTGNLKEVSEHFGVKYDVMIDRLRRGWTLEEAVGLVERARSKVFEVGGFKGTKKEIAQHFGIKYNTLCYRLTKGWTLEEAVGLVERQKPVRGEVFEVGGFKGTKRQIAEHFGIDLQTFIRRLESGRTLEEAVGIKSRNNK